MPSTRSSYTPARPIGITESKPVCPPAARSALLTMGISIFLLIIVCNTLATAAWQPTLSEQDIADISSAAILKRLPTARSAARAESDHQLGLQVLMVETQETKLRKPGDALLAEVFTYDYRTNRATRLLMNAFTHELVESQPIIDIHLPLNENEIDFAINILMNKTDFLAELNHEYETYFGSSISSIAEIETKVSIWDPGKTNTNSICRLTRCALVSVFTHNHFNFSIEPVIVLENASVHLDWVQ